MAAGDADDRTVSLDEADADTPERAASRAALKQRLVRGTSVGRYVLEDKIGEGGMGVVYAAHDPELDRRVAIKLLQPDMRRSTRAAGRVRLLREAKAIAQLSHPNVIHVYDVGSFDDHVFLALELVDGWHLGQWLRSEKRSWREIVRVFIAAGRGLAAAHAAGLVHRDFKPENVLIGKDGRVLVTDFGLARADADEEDDGSAAVGSHPLLPAVTEVGAIMGTPGYAAPELLAGARGDARSDQFSFAASLYAGVYRDRPYEATSFAEYRTLLATRPPEPPADSDVPMWIRRPIERGLALDPTARFPSLDAMLAALSADPALRKRTWLIGACALAAAAGASAIAIRSAGNADDEHAQLCRGSEDKLAAVWDDSRREQVKRAFLAADREYAQTAVDAVSHRLDARARAWTKMRTETCEATRLRGEQPEAVMMLRMACLDDRLRELGEVVEVFATADGKVVERAVAATSALSPLERCADVKTLLASIPPPNDPATRAKVEELRRVLGRAKALFDGGKLTQAAELAAPVVETAQKLDYRPLEAEALMRLGEIQVFLQVGEPAAETLRRATRVAEATRYDEIRSRALAWLVGVVGFDLEKPAEALAFAEDAKAALERIGGDPYVESILEGSLGRTYSRTSEYQKMLEHHERSLVLRRQAFGEQDPMTANAYNNVAAALFELGRYREALATHRKALAIREQVLGPGHPDVAMSTHNVGNQYYELGDLMRARANLDAAVTEGKRSLPATHSALLNSQATRAYVLAELGRKAEADAAFDELFAVLRAGPKNKRLAGVLASHAALVLVPAGHAKQALAQTEEALAIFGADNPDDNFALALDAKARALAALGKLDAALATYREAIAIDEKVGGADHPLLIMKLVGAAEVHLARHRNADARALLERALAICDSHEIGGKWRARVGFTLARALDAASRERAIELARNARVWYAEAALAGNLAEIDAWLAANR
jgi:tetratricopeptide (TPR) repeat protein